MVISTHSSHLWCFSTFSSASFLMASAFPSIYSSIVFPHYFSSLLINLYFLLLSVPVYSCSSSLAPIIFFSSYLYIFSQHFNSFPLFPIFTNVPTSSSSFPHLRSSTVWPLCITEPLYIHYCTGRYMGHEYLYPALCALHIMQSVQLLYLSVCHFFPHVCMKNMFCWHTRLYPAFIQTQQYGTTWPGGRADRESGLSDLLKGKAAIQHLEENNKHLISTK